MSFATSPVVIHQTDHFVQWQRALKDDRVKARITNRLARIRTGNFGDIKSVGGGICEIRIDVGPGYRIYFVHRGRAICVLLCGGNKSSQQADIARARALAEDLGAPL
jgi:putative addiction module killer protein